MSTASVVPTAPPMAPPDRSLEPLEHEELIVRRGTRSGLHLVVAIHSTALGPALGGARLWRYGSPRQGIADALRLARGMTFKAAVAGLDLGGGKGVICAGQEMPHGLRRRAVLLDFADLVESLDGRYIAAEDVGTSTADMVVIGERTRHVVGRPPERGGSGDPSPFTALGVESAMRSCCARRLGSSRLAGLAVCVVGLGKVGSELARRLHDAGVELLVSDLDGRKRELAAQLGARWIDPDGAVLEECDVLAPCALGGMIDAGNVDRLRCAVVCGSANNVLADDALAAELDARGILHAPDFIANAGGLISVYREIREFGPERARQLVAGIGVTMDRVLDAAAAAGVTPLRAAYTLAGQRLESACADGARAGTLPV